MQKDKYIYKLLVYINTQMGAIELRYQFPEETLNNVREQIETRQDKILLYPDLFEGRPFLLNVSQALGVTIEKVQVKTKSGIEVVSDKILVDANLNPINKNQKEDKN